MYTVYGSLFSRARRVYWMLEEIGQPYEAILKATPRSDTARSVNPASGKVPVMVVDGVTLTDSTAILTYLADRHQALTWPAGTLDRARQDGITHFLLDEMDACLWVAARHSFVLPEAMRVPDIKPSLKQEWAVAEARLAGRLGDQPFLMGDRMTVPDIIAASCIGWAISAKFPVENPTVRAYFDTLRRRPAYERVAALV